MTKLKPRIISYDRLLFILSTVNPNNPTIDIGIQHSLVPKVVASIGVSTYVIQPDVPSQSIADTVKANLAHIAKYSIHTL